jgi:membrane fusion protein (multidrug efflux system)
VATPVERGTRVASGADMIRIAPAEAQAQAAEAEANAAQIESRLGLGETAAFDIDTVPEVANARASLTLAQSEFDRAKMLFDKKLLSQAEFDQKSAQAEVARRQFDIARNAAVQQYQSLLAARARVSLARKALADTVVRAPFSGVVGERLVSVGDYVTRGTKVVSVMRTNPLRLQLTVPQQFSIEVGVGRAVALEVDTAPGKIYTGQVRYVSPALQTDSRTLIVEAVVANADGELKPGSFATARIEQITSTPGVLVPAAAVRTVSGTSRVFVVAGGRAEERLITTGQTVGDLVEITTGLKAGEQVATTNLTQLVDGVAVAASGK